jgi:tetratricopeptide (TPR) repeat protein
MKPLLFICLLLTSLITLAQENPFSQATKLINEFRYERALDYLELCNEPSKEILFKKAFCNFKLGNYATAKGLFKEVLSQDSLHIETLANLGFLYMAENNYNASYKCFVSLSHYFPDNSFYHKQAAYSAYKNGDMKAALENYEITMVLNPKDLEAGSTLIDLLILFERNTEAEALTNSLLAIDAENVKILSKKAKMAYKAKDYLKNYETVKNLLLLGDTASFSIQMAGISCFHLKKYKESINYLTILLNRNEESEVVHYYLGLAYRESGFHNTALIHLNKATELAVSANISHYYTQLGVTYEEKKNFPQAIKSYQTAYQKSGDKVLLYHLARSYDLQYKDKKQAIKYYEKYLFENDTLNASYMEYSKYRVRDIKGALHFSGDTLN